jgi:hypothetical protein
MAETGNYQIKQGLICILVFVCLGVAFTGGSAPLAVGSILAACGLCFWAATMEPEKGPEEHHH